MQERGGRGEEQGQRAGGWQVGMALCSKSWLFGIDGGGLGVWRGLDVRDLASRREWKAWMEGLEGETDMLLAGLFRYAWLGTKCGPRGEFWLGWFV